MKNTEIILIDDDSVSLLLSKHFLGKSIASDKTTSVISFTSARDGLSHITKELQESQSKARNIKILLDINMPEINGWQFLQQLNLVDPDKKIRVIMHSSSIDMSDMSAALSDTRVDSYVAKPMMLTKANFVLNLFTMNSTYIC